jgi:predicted polyphosphate/ATP-dependent NAD kinase
MRKSSSDAPYLSLEVDFAESIAKDLSENIESDFLYIFGSEEFTQVILKNIDEPHGATVISSCDLKDSEIKFPTRHFFEEKKVRIITCPDEDGYVLRDESENLDPELLGMIDKECVQIIANMRMITQQKGAPFIVETGLKALDKSLSGYSKVITSYRRRALYPVIAI